MTLDSPVTELKGVGEIVGKLYARLGLHTIADLIDYYPRDHEDYSVVSTIKQLRPGAVTIKAVIKEATGHYVRRGMHITEAVASDESGSVRLVWFNQPYREASLRRGQEYYISGNFEFRYRRFAITSPSVELVSEFPLNTARIVPVYRETKGLTSRQIRAALGQVLPLVRTLPETLPVWLIAENHLMSFAEAVEQLHFPVSREQLDKARERLAFEEVFGLVLASLMNKYEIMNEHAPAVAFEEKVAKDFVTHLPFSLTDAQRKTIWQIYLDMSGASDRSHSSAMQGSSEQRTAAYKAYAKGVAQQLTPQRAESTGRVGGSADNRVSAVRVVSPMNRLVEGDVGSGKTVVAAMAAVMVLHHGHQVAFMAPTEILARQHAETLANLLKPLGYDTQVGLLVGSMSTAQKKKAHEAVSSGKMRFIVGTHALIQDAVDMHQLELIIIDEQHRFGVEQRKSLIAKAGHMPHVLNLTATPIPRSLALTLYGELDISILDSKPAGRQPIKTTICSPNSRAQLYEDIRRELDAGRQMFVVCPVITESDVLAVSSAEKTYEQFATKDFKTYRVGLLHGKMKPAEKQAVMQDFVDHKLDILVATTVIEVGVDVPNASVMLIEAADRFGLAQIHQLRGRIGRGQHPGFCYLMMSDSRAPSARLRALERSSDGFKLAELDLELRGPGAIYGTYQHGQLDLRIAKLTDIKLIARARQAAQEFIDNHEDLTHYPEFYAHVKQLRAVTNLN